MEITFIHISVVWIQRDTSYRRIKACAKINNTQMWWTLKDFPLQCEGRCDVCCGEASGTKFQNQALRWNKYPFSPPPSLCLFVCLFEWTSSSTDCLPRRDLLVSFTISKFVNGLFVAWATTESLFRGWLLRFLRILNSLVC